MNFSPLEIEICLWYYSRAEDWKEQGCAVWPSIRNRLIEDGLIVYEPKNGMLYQPTERLRAFVQAICSLPLPNQVWVMPQTEPKQFSTVAK